MRKFESGQSDALVFARDIIDELNLRTNEAEFIDEFTRWPRGLFPGGLEMLEQLRRKHTIACLSNTNYLHWQRFRNETIMLDLFHTTLASHETGLLKPDAAAFDHAVAKLGVKPGEILFMDDNQINVDGALAAGLEARLTKGIRQARLHMKIFGLLL